MSEFIPFAYEKEEELAYAEFEKFAEKNKKVYSKYNRAEPMKHFDVYSQNYTGGCEVVELKLRDKQTRKYKDCFIEPKKYKNLLNDWINNDCMPIYVNFIGDYKDVYVWYIPEVTGYTYYPKVKIDGEWVPRFGLKWEDARHYEWNEELQDYTSSKPVIVNKLNKKAKKIDNE